MSVDELVAAIENKTVLLLAGLADDPRTREQQQRYQQLLGMIELARLLELEPTLQTFLEHHRDQLR